MAKNRTVVPKSYCYFTYTKLRCPIHPEDYIIIVTDEKPDCMKEAVLQVLTFQADFTCGHYFCSCFIPGSFVSLVCSNKGRESHSDTHELIRVLLQALEETLRKSIF